MKNSITKTIAAIMLLAAGFTISCSGTSTERIEEPRISIHEATFMGNSSALEQHIAFGSDLNAKDEYGSTPLNIAVTFGKTDLAIMLINSGADLSVTAGDGSTALHTAAFFGRTEIVEALLEKGIDTQVRNSYGSTAAESLIPAFEEVKVIYDQMARDLGPLGLRLDYDAIKSARPVIAQMISDYNNAQ